MRAAVSKVFMGCTAILTTSVCVCVCCLRCGVHRPQRRLLLQTLQPFLHQRGDGQDGALPEHRSLPQPAGTLRINGNLALQAPNPADTSERPRSVD